MVNWKYSQPVNRYKNLLLALLCATVITTVLYEIFIKCTALDEDDFLYEVQEGTASFKEIDGSFQLQYEALEPVNGSQDTSTTPTSLPSENNVTKASSTSKSNQRIALTTLVQPTVAYETSLYKSRHWKIIKRTGGYNHLIVRTNGSFLERVKHFNEALDKLRNDIWSLRQNLNWKPIADEVTVIWGNSDDFLEKLSKFTFVKTLALAWESTAHQKWSSLNDGRNLLIQQYYEWTATYPLSMWLTTLGFTRGRFDAVYNRTCYDDIELSLKPQSLEYVYLNGKPINPSHYWPNNGESYPSYFYTQPPPTLFHIHVVENALITLPGDIFSSNLKFVPYTCAQDTDPRPPAEYLGSPIYREVFIITQFWGNEFFHKMFETLPRITPYLDFLKKNKDILVHVNGDSAAEMLLYMGIEPERLVTGLCRAKLVYMPQGTPCGFPRPQNIQLLSHYLRLSLDHQYHNEPFMNISRKYLVLIKRTGLRKFIYQDTLEKTLAQIASEYNLYLQIFPDNPTPPLYKAFAMFNKAVVVVAPHGAGLANMLFCEPGTLIMEGVCNPPHVNMCFQWAAHGLGHRYHGIPSRGGCEHQVEVFPETIDFVLRRHLSLMKKMSMI